MMLPSGLPTCKRTLKPWGWSKGTPRKSALPLMFRHFYISTKTFLLTFPIFSQSFLEVYRARVKMQFWYMFSFHHFHGFVHRTCRFTGTSSDVYTYCKGIERNKSILQKMHVWVNWPSDHPGGVTLTVREEEQKLGSEPMRTLIVPLLRSYF